MNESIILKAAREIIERDYDFPSKSMKVEVTTNFLKLLGMNSFFDGVLWMGNMMDGKNDEEIKEMISFCKTKLEDK